MKTEELKAIGLTDEQIAAVMATNGKDIKREQDKAAQITTERDALKTQLDDANTQIAGFKDLDVDGMKRAVDEWKQKAEAAQRETERVRFNGALDAALTEHKARNPKAVRALLNTDALKLTETGIIGLTEQLIAIKKDNAYLFEGGDKKGAPDFSGTGAPEGTGDWTTDINAALRASFGSQTAQ